MSASTSVPARPADRIRFELVPRLLTVHRVDDLSASMRRVHLGGPELEGFASLGPTDHAKVFFPPSGGEEPRVPRIHDGRWADRDEPGFVFRDYTVRTFDAAAGEVMLDMVVHHHGPAGRWAAQALPGQRLGLLGPKSSVLRPLDRAWYLLVADEAGLPALLNWLDRLPDPARVTAVIEVGGPDDEVPLPPHPGLAVTWVHRGTAPAGSAALADAVAGLPLDVRSAPGYVWAGAEASAVRALRRHLRDDRGLEPSSTSLSGYWRRGVANFDHHSPEATG
jgi:NADPH-dependent ferric siderophore reductase